MEESHEQAQDRKAKRKAFINSINKIDFFDPRKPWIVVPNGSFMGYFNWVRIDKHEIYMNILFMQISKEHKIY